MATLAQDLRFAVRTLSKAPFFTAVAVFSLSLGIGANTAIFTLTDQVLLRYLPVHDPEQLVLLSTRGSHYGSNNGTNALSYPMYADFRDRNTVFSGMFCRYGMPFSLTVEGKTERASGELVSGNYFPVLGVKAALGRTFTAADDLYQGAHPYAVLSYGYWKSRFGMDRNIIGKKLTINGYPITVIGVSQAGFDGTDPAFSPQIRVPMMMKKELTAGPWYGLNMRRSRFANVFGRLKPGVSLTQAKASLQPLYHSIIDMEVREKEFAKATPYTKEQFLKSWMDVLPASKGRSQLRRQFSTPLLVLMGVVALVLLIACANVANLLIARATARQKEIAVRLALGATRGRIVRQLLVESLLLSLVGGAAGLLLAVWLDGVLIRLLPAGNTPLSISAVPDWRILMFTLAVSLLTGVLFGLIPALQSTRPELAPTLKDQAGAVVLGTSASIRKGLVVSQVALSLLLLIGASLFIRSLKNLKELDPGFTTRNLVAFSVDPTLNGYKPERSRQFYRQLEDALRALPGVKSATLAVVPVLDDNEWDSTVTVQGYTPKTGEQMNPHMQYAAPGFFSTLSVPLSLGRDFTTQDERTAAKVAIVNERFAKRFFGSRSPIGAHVGMGGDPGTKTDITIIGVAKDTKYENMRDQIPEQLYLPYRQVDFIIGMTAYVRTGMNPEQLFPQLRRTVQQIDGNVPVYNLRTLEEQVDRSLVTERLVASLSSVFGLLATVLAAVGLYGVMAYTVTRRTREIGIRMALGAISGDVVWLVMREVLWMVGAGMAIGLPAAWALTRLVQTQLFGISPTDPVSIALAMFGIGSVALMAGYLPARRATRVDPMRALRWE